MEQKNKTLKQRQDETKDLVVEQLKKTPIIELTCKKINIGRATFYRWRKDDQQFAEQVQQALDEGLATISDLAESRLISAIQDDNLSAIIFWLKHRHRAYGNKLEISGNIKADTNKLTPEQEQAILKALELSNLNNNKGKESL